MDDQPLLPDVRVRRGSVWIQQDPGDRAPRVVWTAGPLQGWSPAGARQFAEAIAATAAELEAAMAG